MSPTITRVHQEGGRFPIGNPGNPGKMRFGGLGGLGGCIFTAHIMKRIARKLPNPSFLWFLDLADMTMTPEINIVYLWRHQDTPNNPRTNPKPIKQIYILENLGIWSFENVGHVSAPQLLKIRNIFWKHYVWNIEI